ncbi:hypothetical protein GWK47_049479 [Chionoecetes opilio]|uniref:C-type lectin domain-containing protein n=1 Tax=Chionoecetes opilio TaxID=41210 RepID=A0A8J4YBP6_CHIOP|nr:hypothetical protein GWK47_049479 [Chionoecetes opilio]
MKAVTVAFATLLSVATAQTCAGDFELVGSACYLIPTEEYDWFTAMEHCNNLPLPNGKMAALARVQSCHHLVLLWQHITDKGYPIVDYWLGGTTALDTTGVFRWNSTGEMVPMGVPFWFPGQPDRPHLERALSLSKTGYFADENEIIRQRFICQLV